MTTAPDAAPSTPPPASTVVVAATRAEQAGASIVKQPEHTVWGGYSGYFADPEGYLWEVATGATKLPFAE